MGVYLTPFLMSNNSIFGSFCKYDEEAGQKVTEFLYLCKNDCYIDRCQEHQYPSHKRQAGLQLSHGFLSLPVDWRLCKIDAAGRKNVTKKEVLCE